MLEKKDRQKAVFSADDFGISKLANANILRMIRMGKLDRVEIMISENISPEEVAELKRSGIKLDIHLHLIDQNSDYWQGNRRLHESALPRVFSFLFRYIAGRTVSEKVELQWAIQIERFEELFGRIPDGIGSHEYIHYFPPYMKVVLRLGERYGIPFVRFGKKGFVCDSLVAKVLNRLRVKSLTEVAAGKLVTTDHMISFDWVNNLNFLERLPEGRTAEVVFHPERDDEFRFLERLDL